MLDEAGPGQTLSLRSLEGVRLETDSIYHDPLAQAPGTPMPTRIT
jgi:hypothetical protein